MKMLKILLAALIALPFLAMLYQSVASAMDARRYPPLGDLIEASGRNMHLYCTGEGSPTVVLEAGAGGGVLGWAWIQPEVAQETRVCSYDRAGYGWSDAMPGDVDAATVAEDLRTLLSVAGEQAPFVLVAHSLGGNYARVFTHAYPEEVLGVVLLDARNPLVAQRLESYDDDLSQTMQMMRMGQVLARFGVMRLLGDMDGMMQPLPDGVREAAIASSTTPRHLRTYLRELESLPSSDAFTTSAHSYGDRPLTVLAAGLRYGEIEDSAWEVMVELQKDLTTLSTNAKFINVPAAHHVSIVTERENAKVVSEAILQLVRIVRGY